MGTYVILCASRLLLIHRPTIREEASSSPSGEPPGNCFVQPIPAICAQSALPFPGALPSEPHGKYPLVRALHGVVHREPAPIGHKLLELLEATSPQLLGIFAPPASPLPQPVERLQALRRELPGVDCSALLQHPVVQAMRAPAVVLSWQRPVRLTHVGGEVVVLLPPHLLHCSPTLRSGRGSWLIVHQEALVEPGGLHTDLPVHSTPYPAELDPTQPCDYPLPKTLETVRSKLAVEVLTILRLGAAADVQRPHTVPSRAPHVQTLLCATVADL